MIIYLIRYLQQVALEFGSQSLDYSEIILLFAGHGNNRLYLHIRSLATIRTTVRRYLTLTCISVRLHLEEPDYNYRPMYR